jgi:hypothetical protein
MLGGFQGLRFLASETFIKKLAIGNTEVKYEKNRNIEHARKNG